MTAESRATHASSPPAEWMLVVDDDPEIRNVIVQLMEGCGAEVVEAGEAMAALDVLDRRATEPVLVLVDVLMPGMDGLTLTRKLQSRLRRSRLVIISGHLSEESWWPMDLQEVPFLAKPFRRDDLLAQLDEARRNREKPA